MPAGQEAGDTTGPLLWDPRRLSTQLPALPEGVSCFALTRPSQVEDSREKVVIFLVGKFPTFTHFTNSYCRSTVGVTLEEGAFNRGTLNV